MERLDAGRTLLEKHTYTPRDLGRAGIEVNQDGARRSGMEVLSFPTVEVADLVRVNPDLADIDAETMAQLNRDATYVNYIARQARDVEMLRRDEAVAIPQTFDYGTIDGLSNELKAKLAVARPDTLAQASRIEGMTPAALSLILIRLRHPARSRSA
jgi:tRNA uridine 5-carboxymethylaminomethyl modification enzyme